MNSEGVVKFIFAIVVSVYFIHYIQTVNEWHFILDFLNLVIHEAGHFIFIFFGTFMHILGGTLLQILVPILFTWHFIYNKQYFSAAIIGNWLGISFLNASVYASDAIVMQLPLLGGDSSGHDWNNMLSMLNMLEYTPVIAKTLYAIGVFIIAASCVCALVLSYREMTGKENKVAL